MKKFSFLFFLGLIFVGGIYSCSSSGSQVSDEENVADSNDNTGGSNDNSEQNGTDDADGGAESLIGTPFEGLETGDGLYWRLFIENSYQTISIESVPIPIFLAFFSPAEEFVIQEGIDIANEAIGFEAFEVTSSWSNEVRLIVKVDEIADPTFLGGEPVSALGKTHSLSFNFENKTYADEIVTDWQIELVDTGIDKWTVAHELGHAFGIISHALIDYESDVLIDLEDNSLMMPSFSGEPELSDYTSMMRSQGELLLRHLGETSDRQLKKSKRLSLNKNKIIFVPKNLSNS